METIIKVNLESRHASLIEGSVHVSLLKTDNVMGSAIYLDQNQQHQSIAQKDVILFVFQGSGEIKSSDGQQELILQMLTGDVIFIPKQTTYQILNVMPDSLKICELLVGN